MRCAPIQQERVLARREQSRGRAIGSGASAVEGHGGGYDEHGGAIFLAILVPPGIDEQGSEQTIRTIAAGDRAGCREGTVERVAHRRRDGEVSFKYGSPKVKPRPGLAPDRAKTPGPLWAKTSGLL